MINKMKLYPKFGDVCAKCGYSSCDHNEDPVCNCPGTVGNPGNPNPLNYYDKKASLLLYAKDDRIAALTAEVERLKQGIQATVDYVLTGVHCRMADHMTDSCDCQKISGEFEKLIAQPKGGPDA